MVDHPRDQIEPIIDNWIIGELNAERNRYIIKRRLFDGVPYRDLIGEIKTKYGVYLSDKQMSRIVSKGIKIITRHLG